MSEASGYAFRDPRPLGGAVVLWQWIYLVATALNLATTGILLARSEGAPGAGGLGWLAPVLDWYPAVYSVIFLVTAVLFLKWTYRVVANAGTMGQGRRYSPVWAIGWYFIPIATWFKPFEYFKWAWEVAHNPTSPAQVYTSGLLRWWWGLWVAQGILGAVSFRLALIQEAGAQQASDVVSMLSDAVTLPAVFVVVLIVRRLSERQFETHAAGAAAVFA
jgi:hypothetical protein